MPIELICLDADDTLWHNDDATSPDAGSLPAPCWRPSPSRRLAGRRLEAVERRNLRLYGYGAKGFTLSLIETAMELTGGDPPGQVIADILAAGREMLAHPVESAARASSRRWPSWRRPTAGADHQGRPACTRNRSSPPRASVDLFAAVEIVSDKKPATYAAVFARHGVAPGRALMAGNSLRSDVLPALAAGAWAAYVPHALVWSHENADEPKGHPRYRRLDSLSDLPGWVGMLDASGDHPPASSRAPDASPSPDPSMDQPEAEPPRLPDMPPHLRAIAMPADTNPAGDIFGGWLMAQMDLAAGNAAARRARGAAPPWRSTR